MLFRSEEAQNGAGPHILLVEDNRVNRDFATEMLEILGCRVSAAEKGRIAVEKVTAEDFDLILMDVQMPELDGHDATRQIRQLESVTNKPRNPIVALTANAMKGDREKCMAAGMDDYLSKPVRKSDLRAALLRWLPEGMRAAIESDVADAGQAQEARVA